MTPYCATTPNGSSEDGWHGKPRFWRSLTLPSEIVLVLVLDLDRCRSSGGVNGVPVVRQDDAKSPGSDGASPYLPKSCSFSCSILIVADQAAGSTGFNSHGRMTPKPRFGRGLTLPSVIVLGLVLDLSSLPIKGTS
jgi:hypothetical protein